MPDLDLIRKLAFSFLKKADAELLRTLIDKGISAEQFFTMETAELAHALRLSQGNRFEKMERDEAIFRALKELEAIERHHITPLSLLDNDYPVRLAQIPDAPVVLYKLGDADLDSRHIVNLVGTQIGRASCRERV